MLGTIRLANWSHVLLSKRLQIDLELARPIIEITEIEWICINQIGSADKKDKREWFIALHRIYKTKLSTKVG
jgi:hypothetical protein